MSITIKDINKVFGKTPVLKDIHLNVRQGELLALLGPSGSGKTTLLRIIAGLEHVTKGDIYFEDKNVTHEGAQDRSVGFVFQHYALFPHMKVKDNIAYGLRVRKRKSRLPNVKITEKVQELLRLVKLEAFGDHYPNQLSGGQKQRVALARALAINPSVLLLDEPFGALDAQVRKELRKWLKTLHKQTGVTTLFVTHDQEEALDVADQVVVLKDGEIIQRGTPINIYESPNSPFMYRFLGNANELNGVVTKDGVSIDGLTFVSEWTHTIGAEIVGYIRPHEISISHTESSEHQLAVTISSIHHVGPVVFIEAKRKHGEKENVEIELSKSKFDELSIRVGDHMYARIDRLRTFESEDYCI
ncbi:sulfate/molybdate ABC transporter ATP-binding protein [Geomicrobium sp. JCM 19039]|uniref:sulfate/molybdate ABC transporter ATP-binding protein n=1 Tax=Geomicrobium sp. JCM 19039 TaxID=1460636 RepID=UPI00045F3AC2|nr:sulfate/molybdate ABC transporter ATP-binding protein [Geomicrobium sp. JCM 19039]GAK11823.1 sulfate and thiosulfate import ATP-binding protein CysA [Geomicrobium sp. JCM 19039]